MESDHSHNWLNDEMWLHVDSDWAAKNAEQEQEKGREMLKKAR